MAYLVNLDEQCRMDDCSSKATVEVRTFRNEVYGKYCKRHGGLVLKQVEDYEQLSWSSRKSEEWDG